MKKLYADLYKREILQRSTKILIFFPENTTKNLFYKLDKWNNDKY